MIDLDGDKYDTEQGSNPDVETGGCGQGRGAGALVVPQQFQKLHGGQGESEQNIWEIKATGTGKYGAWRAACFQRGATWWITHFFKTSHKSAAVSAAMTKAARARSEHIAAEEADQ